MARCKCPSFGPNQAYLLSFGDCMTALLAFFIVLNSMAAEQTGANLHAGTGSFNRALNSHGLPGLFPNDRSKRAVQLNDVAPTYMVDDLESDDFGGGSGPDETDDNGRIFDRAEEQFSRFLEQSRRMALLKREVGIRAEVSFDVMTPIASDDNLLSDELQKTLTQLRTISRKPDRVIEITVWATTPSQSAWTRAATQAEQIRQEAIRYLNIETSQRNRITANGRTWISSTLKRPSVTITLRQLEAAGR
jgi:flagellar motor protein MotB